MNGAETVMSMCRYLDDGWVASAEKVIPELVLTSNDLNPNTGEEKEVKINKENLSSTYERHIVCHNSHK